MSIKTTHFVTREFAIAAILKKLDEANDQQLAYILEEVLHNGFYNFRVVSQEEMDEDDKDEWPMPKLTDLDDLPEYNDAG